MTEPDDPNRELVQRFFAATDQGDRETVAALSHPDIVMAWPQSGERFRGVDNVLGAMAATEIKPEVVGMPRLFGSGSTWVFMAPLRYGEETFEYVGILELEDGLVRRATGYWGAPFPPQEGRARFRDREP